MYLHVNKLNWSARILNLNINKSSFLIQNQNAYFQEPCIFQNYVTDTIYIFTVAKNRLFLAFWGLVHFSKDFTRRMFVRNYATHITYDVNIKRNEVTV